MPSVRGLLLNNLAMSQGAGGPKTFTEQMLALPGLLAYWPQTDADASAVADNAEGTADRDATYYLSSDTYVLHQNTPFPTGDNVAWYLTSGRLRFGTASLAAAWNWNDCWLMGWVLPDETEQAGAANKGFWGMKGTASTIVQLYHGAIPYQVIIDHRPVGDSVNRLSWIDWCYSANFTQIAMLFRYPNAYLWRNGVLVKTREGITQATDDLDISNPDFNVLASGKADGAGAFPHFAVGANAALTTDLVNNLYEAVYPNAKSIFVAGDSYATDNDYWISKTVGNLEYATPGDVWRERPYRIGRSGQRVAALHAELDANINSYVGTPDVCLVHIGTNDVTGTPTDETAFKTDLRGVIEALYGKWGKPVYCALPYRADGDYDAACAAVATWITAVCGEYAYAHVGPDYTASWWVDNMEILSDDSVHPNNAGHIAIAAQWATILTA